MNVTEVNQAVLAGVQAGKMSLPYTWPENGHNVPRCPDPARAHAAAIERRIFDEERVLRDHLKHGKVSEAVCQALFKDCRVTIAEALAMENDITRVGDFISFVALVRVFPHFYSEELNCEFDIETYR